MAARSRLQIQEASISDVVEVVSSLMHARSTLAIARDRTVNEFWIDCANVIIRKAKPCHHARPELFDENVSALNQRDELLQPSLVLEIESCARFATIEHEKRCAFSIDHWRKAPRVFAIRMLDLGHFGAGLREHQRR